MNDFIYTFLFIVYLHKRNYECSPCNKCTPDTPYGWLVHHETLSDAIEECNEHANCNCVEFIRFIKCYRTSAGTTQVSDHKYDSLVISFFCNQTIDPIIKCLLSYHT